MTGDTAQSVLKRKTEAGRTPPGVPTTSPGKALRLALAKAAQDALRLVLVVEDLTEQRLSLTEVLDDLPDRALLAVLEGPSEGIGLMVLSPQSLAALIEVQTMGRVAPGEAVVRRPTRTDAAMAAPFIDQALAALEAELAGETDLVWAAGFRYASFLDDPRPLGLLLEDTVYRVFRITLDLGLGAKRGDLLLALPAHGRGAAPVRAEVMAQDNGSVWSRSMQQTVMSTPARLDAVLHRLTLPLAAVMRLKVGDMVGLPMAAIDQLTLEGAGGRRLAQGRLGQTRGHRAVRLRIEDAEAAAGAMPGSADGAG